MNRFLSDAKEIKSWGVKVRSIGKVQERMHPVHSLKRSHSVF